MPGKLLVFSLSWESLEAVQVSAKNAGAATIEWVNFATRVNPKR